MKSEDEIHRAHDLLRGIVLEENGIPNPLKGTPHEESLTSALDVLCWVLGHDHNVSFRDNLRMLEDYLAAHGVVLNRVN